MALPRYDYGEWRKRMKFLDTWMMWRNQKPSFKHPIEYIKWYLSEPKYGKEPTK